MSKISYYNNTFLDTMRYEADPLADKAVEAVYQSGNPHKLREILAGLEKNGTPVPQGLPEKIRSFFEISGQMPPWAQKSLMKKGVDFFSRYAGDLMMMLGLLSLPYDYAAAHGAQVLYLSERLHHNPGKRLLETGQYILNVTAKNAFSSHGKAIRSAQKVRLMHAAIRYHIKQNGQWDLKKFGSPVNQEDMAGTNLSISLIPVRGLRKLNLKVSHEEMLAYVHLWNVAAYMMGVDERLLPDTAKEAFVLEKMIFGRHHAPSEAGQNLTKSLIKFFEAQSKPGTSNMAPAYMRYLLGEEIADWLSIPTCQIPEEMIINSIRGFNYLRNFMPDNTNAYYQVKDRLNRQIKNFSITSDHSTKFKMPNSLTS